MTLKELIESKGKTVYEVGMLSGITKQKLSYIVKHGTDSLKLTDAAEIARVLDMDLNELFAALEIAKEVKDKEFNLLEEKWIKIFRNGEEEISLIDLFEDEQITMLAGESKAQDYAILRFLMAILYRVVDKYDLSLDDIWKEGKYPIKEIKEYLNEYKDRFWLFHDEYPFLQENLASQGTFISNAKLIGTILESNNKARLFNSRSNTNLDYAEAARWLFYINGFDDSSIKAKINGNPDGISAGVSYLGRFTNIYPEGDTLFETLMMNVKSEHAPNQKPMWEVYEQPTTERNLIDFPNNEAQLLTTQFRYLLLSRNVKGEINGCYDLSGNFFKMDTITNIEKNVLLNDNKSFKTEVLLPKTLNIVFYEMPDCLKDLKTASPFVRLNLISVNYGRLSSCVDDSFEAEVVCSPALLERPHEASNALYSVQNQLDNYIHFMASIRFGEGYKKNSQDYLGLKAKIETEVGYELFRDYIQPALIQGNVSDLAHRAHEFLMGRAEDYIKRLSGSRMMKAMDLFTKIFWFKG